MHSLADYAPQADEDPGQATTKALAPTTMNELPSSVGKILQVSFLIIQQIRNVRVRGEQRGRSPPGKLDRGCNTPDGRERITWLENTQTQPVVKGISRTRIGLDGKSAPR
jgi:hypothetical protein